MTSCNSQIFFLLSVTLSAPIEPPVEVGDEYLCPLSTVGRFRLTAAQTLNCSSSTNFPITVLCVGVYSPPKFNKDFIQDFADCVVGVVLNYDRLFIVGDYNIHVCFEARPLVRDLLILNSFNLTQSVTCLTHGKGHTLDLVLSLGLCVAISGVCDTCISDHLPVLCTVTVSSPDVSTCAPACRQHAINPLTASQFSAASEDIVLYTLDVSDLSADNLTTLFNCTCTEILDSNATSKGALQHFLRPG